VRSKWGVSDNNRRAKYYALTAAGKKQLAREQHEWRETNLILSWFLSPEPISGAI